ncbi:MAG: hypothetical protein Q8L88_04225 [Bacteroidota bacterium]|nr:hypothetical protein [Bacteroidota bacterium]
MRLKKAVQIAGIVAFLFVGITALWLMQQPVKAIRNIQLSDSVVAVIGNSYITVSELKQAFETAHPVIKYGATYRERLHSVLASMLAEKVLSQEASRLGFKNNKRVEQLHNEFQRKAVVERVITSDVDSKITVTNDEANEETMKSLVSFKFRYWMEPTKERAQRVRIMMQEKGYAAVVQQLASQNPELKGIAPQLESDYLRWTEIESTFYEAIKTLPVGDISVPIEYDGAFYLLQIVDIRRGGMTTAALANSIPTSKKVIFARKRIAARKAYVGALMEPKNVKTNASSLKILVQAVGDWYSSSSLNSVDFFTALDKADGSYPKLQAFKKEQSRILVTTIDKQFSITEIARLLPLRKIMKEHHQVFAAFAAYTAASVRDHYLEQLGVERDYQNDPESLENLRVWNDKWLYEEYRLKFTLQKNVVDRNSADNGVRQYIVKKDQIFLIQKIDSFVHQYPLQLNRTVLDTMQINEPTLSRYMPMSFVRGGTDVPAFPIIGNEWQNAIPKLKNIFGIQQNNSSTLNK